MENDERLLGLVGEGMKDEESGKEYEKRNMDERKVREVGAWKDCE